MRRFRYVGPMGIFDEWRHGPGGTPVTSRRGLLAWMDENRTEILGDAGWVTYIVNLDGDLFLAPRRTEHVGCARGADVLAAGEIRFSAEADAIEVTNNSTGYCPAEGCWSAVRSALDRAGLKRPSEFTFVARFRRCPECGQRNLVKDDWYRCDICGAELPSEWNFAME